MQTNAAQTDATQPNADSSDSPLAIVDCNNFWSPSGGGVRRYHLEKLAYYQGLSSSSIRYVFVMPDEKSFTEQRSSNVIVEHVKAMKQPGPGEYRLLTSSHRLREVFEKHSADVIEVGSPWVLPGRILKAVDQMSKRPALAGFWHADFPRAYLGRFGQKMGAGFERRFEKMGWGWAKRTYGQFDGIMVASQAVGENILPHKLGPLLYTPLGVHTDCFAPHKRDAWLVDELKAGEDKRLVLFFPHRFQDEKGLKNFLRAYRLAVKHLDIEPAVVFAGDGPDRKLVEQAVAQFKHVRYIGYIRDADEMARWFASCEVAVALSAFETFGLSTAEAMASGQAVIAADKGAAAELVTQSNGGRTVPYNDSEALAQSIIELAKRDDIREIGERGRKHVQQFQWNRTFERQLQWYRKLVDVRRGRSPEFEPGFYRD